MILDHEEELLINPIAYETDIQKFIDFLDKASKEFKHRKDQN